MARLEIGSRRFKAVVVFTFFFAGMVVLHSGLLRLPYFWDEAGYYVPAARDLLLTGSLIPHTTPSNAHPPLVMAYLALCWKIAGYSTIVTRLAMLLVAAFSVLGLLRLAQRVANRQVAIASALCTIVYPVFFVQSSLGQVDLAAAGFTFWALLAYVEKRHWQMVFWFSGAVLAKETAILAPLALALWEMIKALRDRTPFARAVRQSVYLLIPVLPLACWYAYHYLRTGFIFGNPEFFRYNVQATFHPLRIGLALLMRIWQVVGYMNLYVLTLAAAAAMWLPPRRYDNSGNCEERPRIAVDIQFAFFAVVVTYVLAMAVIGGAVLARYMLPVVPLVIIVCVSTLWRRVRWWWGVIALALVGFVAALFVNPPYGFTLEDNLAYRDYIVLHQRAEAFLLKRYPTARVLTAWPASGELSQIWLGYVPRSTTVLQIDDFSIEELASAAKLRPDFDVALVFSTKYDPPHALLENWRAWQGIKTKYFGYHRDVLPAAAAQMLGGKLVYIESRKGQWIGIIQMEPGRQVGMMFPASASGRH